MNPKQLKKCQAHITFFFFFTVGTIFELNPKREWIQAHVAQTMNL